MAWNLVSISVTAIILYLASRPIYHLFFSPISNIPGPKLAAATWWYEYYHDVITYGKYFFKVKQMHEKYGPIVRISPHEVHIDDPDFYDTLYASSGTNRKERWPWYVNGLGLPGCTLATIDCNLHRQRRAAMSSFFSKQKVTKLQPVVEERVRKLAERFIGLAANGEVVSIGQAFAAFSNDVVTQYCFGQADHRIEAEGFDPSFFKTTFAAGTSGVMMRNNNWMLQLIWAMPEKLAMSLSPEFSSFVSLRRERIDQIDGIRQNSDKETVKGTEQATIFHSLLASELPQSEKASKRLAEEAILLLGAGTHTVAWTLSVTTFHLLTNPTIMLKLKAELETAIPNPRVSTPLPILEALPYLTAVIKEGLRLGLGATSRIPRIAIDQPIKYGGYEIPPGIPVSMTTPMVHLNEKVFPDAKTFDPERWIDDKTGHRDKYLVPFTKGPRSCLGLNLAWAELYLCFSTIFRVFGSVAVRGKDDVGLMDLFETDLGDVEMARDGLFVMPKDGTKGIRVTMSK